MNTLATIDLGTNTALMLVSSWCDGALRIIEDRGGYVRLGEGMDASGRVSDAALDRLRKVLESHAAVIRETGTPHTIVTGTSASRDATDGERIGAVVRETLGVDLHVISGREEADLTSRGALAGLDPLKKQEAVRERAVVIDVGGGSTEFIQMGERMLFESLNMGTVRLSERFFDDQPPSGSNIQRAKLWIDQELDRNLTAFQSTALCVGSSGTAHVLATLFDDLQADIPVDTVGDCSERLLEMTFSDVMALNPDRMAGRADVFPMGVLILYRALLHMGVERLIVSQFGVRHGSAIRYFEESAPGGSEIGEP